MNDRELMQQALEALERYGGVDQRACDAEEALRDRLAQPEQEPVAWMNGWGDLFKNPDDAERGQTLTPLYTALPQRKPWVGLTDAELAEFSEAKLGAYDLCLEVEAKLKEKNT